MTKTVKKIDAIDRSLYVLKVKYSKQKKIMKQLKPIKGFYIFLPTEKGRFRGTPRSQYRQGFEDECQGMAIHYVWLSGGHR